ncbi:MAG: hypothetical protein KBD48_02715 [Candidatus Pacebacteria bacterium]|nr:hypothetical protein [Candidatus Paceibacterota bacterium]MBP9716075.1 hypothetical protein [Candidatus Paceibacterota bacterium]
MNKEVRQCQNCKEDFTIETEDFVFYDKIKVPPPTFCPECRCIRRMIHRNERHLFRRTCDVTGKSIISIYPPESPYTVCDKDYYFSDAFDPFKYGSVYNPDLKFFEQFYEFAKKVPLTSLFVRISEKCEYNQDMSNSSNCYLCFRTHDSQNMFYTYRGNKSNNCFDCFQAVISSEFLYECVDVSTCNNSRFLSSCEKCSDSAFLYNCTGCVDCFMCTDQRNKQCYFKNQQYSREEYKKIIDSYNLSTYEGQKKALSEFEEFLKQKPRKNLTIIRSDNVTGDNITDSKDAKYVFNVKSLQNCSYIWDSFRFTDSMDTYSGAGSELLYETTATTAHSSNCRFCVRVHEGSRDCEYSWFLQNCSSCFGCIGLKNQEYCIFNVKYNKDEYEELVGRIKNKMLEDREYGEFFPAYTSPFAYNNTVAHEFFPMAKETALEAGFGWKDLEDKNYVANVDSVDLPGDISNVGDDILNQIISCSHKGGCGHGCTKAFKIVADELSFYRNKKIPVPHECPNCRHYRRLETRNPTMLRDTKCMCEGDGVCNDVYKNTIPHEHGAGPCGKKLQTSIREDSNFIVYCDSCYKKEVF